MGRPVQMMALVVTLAASSIAECGGTAFQAVTNEHSLKGCATARTREVRK